MSESLGGRRQRLDVALAARGLAASRSRAQDLIRRGLVTVDGQVERASARLVDEAQAVAVAASHARGQQVSRGEEKLEAALAHFAFAVPGAICLDVGASTGGFTSALLKRGAALVYAVDVGHGQLDAGLRADARVVALEGCDVRTLSRDVVPEPVSGIVADVSFISLTKALPAALALATPDAWAIVLVKPQFEAGRAAVSKTGLVRAPADRERAQTIVRDFLVAAGWRVLDIIPSPIAGGSGNLEFLLGATRHG